MEHMTRSDDSSDDSLKRWLKLQGEDTCIYMMETDPDGESMGITCKVAVETDPDGESMRSTRKVAMVAFKDG